MIRQQRPARNRRALSANQPPLTPLLRVYIFDVTGTTLTLRANSIPTPPDLGTTTGAPELIVTDVLSLRRSSDNSYPVDTTLDGAVGSQAIVIEYAGGPIAPGEAFTLGTYDPAIRTVTGGYLAPVILLYTL